ncbi:hypothetical protein B0T26DRAFT_669428 [Lasiosphaeria miniovina]|uniref:Fe2OG dioxygenase domain-containing protein n=1 Tax=Lasiosphaeria miniovina TaxID=1954250 RepID=A0AA40BFG1_9PEZI|nr:uncharacterized protein B0T26DRAFT_669428 [Lasiosphaeria miniovina]KAK0732968.1 hypothetical protein B0T26DRAFT_669428 [Lasiosphaeria miniovina]
MPTPFPISPSVLPTLRTRKALLVFDVQNDFVSPDGALPVSGPEGLLSRILAFSKAFRESGAGDVIWVRSEFEEHRPLSVESDRIITSHVPVVQRPSRGRQQVSMEQDSEAAEADHEAFLSLAADGGEKPACVRAGTRGAELAPSIQAAAEAGGDVIFTKTYYSAFASGQQQLVQLLRGRFVTEIYVCGVLTNISIYATAFDVGRHGYGMTVVEDCCGFRDEMRHMNALRQLMQLTGSEVIPAEAALEQLAPPLPPKKKKSDTSRSSAVGRRERGNAGATGAADGSGASQESPRVMASLQIHPQRLPKYRSQSPRLSPPSPPLHGSRNVGVSMTKERARQLHRRFNPCSSTSTSTSSSSSSSGGGVTKKGTAASLKCDTQSRTSSTTSRRALLVDDSSPLEVDPQYLARPLSPKGEEDEIRAKRRLRSQGSNQNSQTMSPGTQTPKEVDKKLASDADTPESIQPRNPENTVIADSLDSKVTSSTTTTKVTITTTTTTSTTSTTMVDKVDDGDRDENAPKNITQTSGAHTADRLAPAPTVSEPLCEGDTTIISHVLPPALADHAFESLLDEVSWAGMSRLGGEVPRRIAVQGEVGDEGSIPVYRHPADESPPLLPFSPTVLQIKEAVEKHLGHPLNHVLIQHYRTGGDYISEHSDKTLDVVRDSFIANVSLGAERTMVFRTKRPDKDVSKKDESNARDTEAVPDKAKRPVERHVERVALPHNSLCRMGLATNMRWLHAIRQDKRSDRDKSPAELAYGGARISLTFRRIGTFLDSSQSRIWGQGATSKTKAGAAAVVNGQTPEAVRLLQAFGTENHSSEFDWGAQYGDGFNVLHLGSPKRFLAGSADAIANMRVSLALAELGIGAAKGSVEGDARFEDNDPARAVVEGHDTVLRYLDAVYGAGRRYDQLPAADVAKRFRRLQQALDLLPRWRVVQAQAAAAAAAAAAADDGGEDAAVAKADAKKSSRRELPSLSALLKKDLAEWEKYAAEAAPATSGDGTTAAATAGATVLYIAGGSQASPADFALWPVLHDIVRVAGRGDVAVLRVADGHLARYYTAFKPRSAVAKVLGPARSAT